MSEVKIGDNWKEIPFDPFVIANMIYEGYEVRPSQNTPEERKFIENKLVTGELEKLWGQKKFKTKGLLGSLDGGDFAPPNSNEVFPGRAVEPTPFVNNKINRIDPEYLKSFLMNPIQRQNI